MAMIRMCMACQGGVPEDLSLEETCGTNATDAEYAGWDVDSNEPIWLCKAVIID